VSWARHARPHQLTNGRHHHRDDTEYFLVFGDDRQPVRRRQLLPFCGQSPLARLWNLEKKSRSRLHSANEARPAQSQLRQSSAQIMLARACCRPTRPVRLQTDPNFITIPHQRRDLVAPSHHALPQFAPDFSGLVPSMVQSFACTAQCAIPAACLPSGHGLLPRTTAFAGSQTTFIRMIQRRQNARRLAAVRCAGVPFSKPMITPCFTAWPASAVVRPHP